MLLGKQTAWPERYTPDILEPVSRGEGRRELGIDKNPPFSGSDLWTAWDFTWLDGRGKPGVAALALRIPADSPRFPESKSLKLYLGSLAMTRFERAADIETTVAEDISRTTGAGTEVSLAVPEAVRAAGIAEFPGTSLDDGHLDRPVYELDAGLLRVNAGLEAEEALFTHLFRSNCPVTGQPDCGSILVRYRGPAIDREALLRYLVSYRRHNAFHEACIERIFMDLKTRCAPRRLTVYGRFTRRGGIDINPFRSDFEPMPEPQRLWRQ